MLMRTINSAEFDDPERALAIIGEEPVAILQSGLKIGYLVPVAWVDRLEVPDLTEETLCAVVWREDRGTGGSPA
jgi:hypothetical protein